MSDVVLINAPIALYLDQVDREKNYLSDGDEFSFYPINLLYLAGYVISKGYSARIIDPTAEGLTLVDIINIVNMENPKLIGMTALTPSVQSLVTIAKCLKNYPKVLGGIHISNDPTFIERFPYFEYGVVGDGEREFLNILEGKRDKGLIYADRIEDLDSLPFPARQLVDTSKYRRPEMYKWEVFSEGIIASRGCPYSCSFCSITQSGKKVRFRSVENVVAEMLTVYEKCKGNFTFNDDCFTLNKTYVISLCERIQEKCPNSSFIISTRINCVDDDILSELRKAGCKNISFGVESGSERIRNEVCGKGISDEAIARTVKLCRKHGISASLFIMIGLPTETKEDLEKTVRISSKVNADYIGVHQTTPYPNSRIYQLAIQEKKIPKDLVDQWARGDRGRSFKKAWLFYVPDGFTQKDMTDYKRKTYLFFYFHYKWLLKNLWRWLRHPIRMAYTDLKLFKVLPTVIKTGGTKGQFS
jgi:anaerobic magnesium-protoporphyrin IX monomethyl ester cyclase